MAPTTWRNWAGNQTADGVTVIEPRGTEEIVAAVELAAREGRRVKPIGNGHSFTAIGRPEGVQLRLDRHDGVLRLDADAGLVTVQAGMPLHRLNEVLAHSGFSMTNLGDIDRQTIAGATSTGTHGTGARFGGLATQIRGLELVTADGGVLTCSAEENADVFRVARVGLGALGVVSAVTLQVEPAFGLRAQESSMPLDEVLARFDELADGTDHFEFFWFPHTTSTLTKRNTRVPAGRRARAAVGAALLVGRRVPVQHGLPARPSGSAAARRRWCRRSTGSPPAPSARAPTPTGPTRSSSRRAGCGSPRWSTPCRAPPRSTSCAASGALIERNGWRTAFPVEVRVAAGDDIPLSTASGRDTAYVAVHQPVGVDCEPYFRAVEAVAADLDGRPHWGKLHWLGAEDIRKRYPELDAFLAVRDRLDPEGRFANAYLDQVLGPAPSGGR